MVEWKSGEGWKWEEVQKEGRYEEKKRQLKRKE